MTIGKTEAFIDYQEREDGSVMVMELGTGVRAYGENPLDALGTLVEALENEYGDEIDT